MVISPDWRRALDEFIRQIRQLYGARLVTVILYGSRARGDADEESDIDTLVVLDPLGDYRREFDRIATVADELTLQHGVMLSAFPMDVREYRNGGSPLLLNIRREGKQVA